MKYVSFALLFVLFVNINSYIKKGDLFLKRGRYEKALFWYKKAYNEKPLDTIKKKIEKARKLYALSLIRKKKYQKAIDVIKNIEDEKFKKKLGKLYYLLAFKKLRKKRYTEALSCLDNAKKYGFSDEKKLKKLYSRVYFSLAYAHYNNGKLDAAIEYLNKAIENNSKNPDAYFLLGIIYEKKDVDKAIEYYSNALKLRPKDYNISYRAAVLLYGSGECNEAIPFFKKTMKIIKGKGLKRIRLKELYYSSAFAVGKCFFENDNIDDALPFLEEAIKGKGFISEDVYIYLIKAYSTKNDLKSALKYAKEYVRKCRVCNKRQEVQDFIDEVEGE